MFYALLVAILALQANALAFGDPAPAPPSTDHAVSVASLDTARLEALKEVIACGVSKIENTDMVESKQSECAKQIANYNEISARFLKARETSE